MAMKRTASGPPRQRERLLTLALNQHDVGQLTVLSADNYERDIGNYLRGVENSDLPGQCS